MQHIEELKNKAQKWKDQLTKTPLERSLSEATSNENWNTPTRISQEIADATYSYTDCNTVMKYIWKCLSSETKDWRRVLKTIALIEYLIKNGAPRCIGEFKDEIFKIRSFSDFYIQDQGMDRGASIREKTKVVMDLLSNEKLIEEERESAKKIKERLNAAGGSQAMGSDSSYQGYSGSSKQPDNDYARKYGEYQKDATVGSQSPVELKGGLDKYRTHKEEQQAPTKPVAASTWKIPATSDAPTVELKKPFQEPAKKLTKPGEDWSASSQSWGTDSKPQAVVQRPETSLIDFEEQVQPKPSTSNSDWTQFPAQVPKVQEQQNFSGFTNAQPQPTAQIQQVQQIQQQFQPQTQQQQPDLKNLNFSNYQQQQQQQQPQQQTQTPNLFQPTYFQQPAQPQFQQQSSQIQYQQQITQPQFQQQISQPQFQQQSSQPQFQQQSSQPQYQQPQMNQNVQQQNLGSLYTIPQQPAFGQPQQLSNQTNYQQQNTYQNQQQQPIQMSIQSPQKDEFQDFQSSNQNQPKSFKSIEDKLLNLTDMSKDIKNDPKRQQTNQQSNQQSSQQQQQPAQLYTSQSEMDTFQLNYRNQPQPQQQQNPYVNQSYNNVAPQNQYGFAQQQGGFSQQQPVNYQQQLNQFGQQQQQMGMMKQ